MAVAEFNGIYLELGRQIAKDLRAVGFNPALRAWNPSHYTEALLEEAKRVPITATSTANGFMQGHLPSCGPANIVGHHDDELDALFQQQASELDSTKRHELMIQIQRHILKQASMFSPVMASSQWVFDWGICRVSTPTPRFRSTTTGRWPGWKGNAHSFLAISGGPAHYQEY